jgi:hypothetical protein
MKNCSIISQISFYSRLDGDFNAAYAAYHNGRDKQKI